MTIGLKLVKVTIPLEFKTSGSETMQMALLCAVSGAAIVPFSTMSDGTLLISGPQ